MKKRANSGRLKVGLGKWRSDEGLTLAEVSGLTGLSVAMLSLVERGERQLAPLTKVMVARRLGVPIAELFEVEELPAEKVAVAV
jgi:transcriptional regulator with XRE-family HTH domain